jgi:hypothetical protein
MARTEEAEAGAEGGEGAGTSPERTDPSVAEVVGGRSKSVGEGEVQSDTGTAHEMEEQAEECAKGRLFAWHPRLEARRNCYTGSLGCCLLHTPTEEPLCPSTRCHTSAAHLCALAVCITVSIERKSRVTCTIIHFQPRVLAPSSLTTHSSSPSPKIPPYSPQYPPTPTLPAS